MSVPLPVRKRIVRSGRVPLALAEAGEAGRPTVVMIHGYPDTKEVWGPVMERLADRFHVVAYDVRGAGGSGAPPATADYRLARLAEDFAAVREAVSPRRPVHLVGHDWGGIQGWEFATAPRFSQAIASFTTIAGPALAHAALATRAPLRAGRPAHALDRARHSWYIVPLCLPGGPQLAWRVLLTPRRWRRYLALEGVATDAGYPAATLPDDGVYGARLYRANIPRRLVRPRPPVPPLCPVQLIVPTRDRFISESYYDAAGQVAPDMRRRTVSASHWVIRTHPDRVGEWIAQFARETER